MPGALNYLDCVGVHANGYNVPPDKTNTEGYNDPTATFRGPFTNPIPSWYFRSTLELYRDTVQNQKPLCVTEFGWGSSEGFGYTPPSYEFVNDNTLQEQGDYIVQAFDLMKQWGYVKTGLPVQSGLCPEVARRRERSHCAVEHL